MDKQDDGFDKEIGAMNNQMSNIIGEMRKQFDCMIQSQSTIKLMEGLERQFKAFEPLQKTLGNAIPKHILFDTSLSKEKKQIEDSIGLPFKKILERLPKTIREALLVLGQHGWYMDMELPCPEFSNLIRISRTEHIEVIEELLCTHIERRIDTIEASLVQDFPKRETILRAAFNAHRKEEYILSIPVLLAQTDGICTDLIGKNLFRKGQRKDGIEFYLERFVIDAWTEALLSPFEERLPVWASEKERSENFTELNRHMVLHGESLDYGTKTNSLKAISLINYVAQMLSRSKTEE